MKSSVDPPMHSPNLFLFYMVCSSALYKIEWIESIDPSMNQFACACGCACARARARACVRVRVSQENTGDMPLSRALG